MPNWKLLTALRTVLGVVLLYYVLSTTGSWSVVKQFISTTWLLPGFVVLTLCGAAVESIRLGILFESQGIRLSFINGYRLVLIGTFFNFCIPGGTGGDIVKLYYLALENRGRSIEVATVLLIDRAVALFALLFLVVGFAILNGKLVMEHTPIQWIIAATTVGMVGMILAVACSCSARVRSGRLYAYVADKASIQGKLKRAWDVLYAFRSHKVSLLVVALVSIVGHLALTGMFLAAGKVFIPDVPGLVVPLLALLGLLVNAVPITPGGLGVGEMAFDRLFRLAGYPGGAYLILAWRVGMLPICLVGGMLYILGFRRQRHFAFETGDPKKT